MKTLGWVVVSLAALGTLARPAAAQLPGGFGLTLELTPAVGVSTGGFASSNPGAGAGNGFGIGGGATLGLGSLVSLYGAYQYLVFACDGCMQSGLDEEVNDAGWEAGLHVGSPVSVLGIRPWLRAGVLGHQLQFTGNGGSLASEPSIGIALGAGTELPLAGGLLLMPALRFRAYSAEFDFSTEDLTRTRATDVSYLTLDLGLAYRF